MTGYNVIHLQDMISELGEDRVKSMLLDFVCPLSKDVEFFLHNKAIEFSKQSLSQTFLVYGSYKGEPKILGYFTLANKVVVIYPSSLTNSLQKKINKFATYDYATKNKMIPSFLIAQLGKNFLIDDGKQIKGEELIGMAINKVESVQRIVGGKVVYLECSNKKELLDFYTKYGFKEFGRRVVEKDEEEMFQETELIQLLKYL